MVPLELLPLTCDREDRQRSDSQMPGLRQPVIGRDTTPTTGSTAFSIADVNRDGTLTVQDIIVQANALLGAL